MKIQVYMFSQTLLTLTLAKSWFAKSNPAADENEAFNRQFNRQMQPLIIRRYSREPSFLDYFKRKKKGHRRVVTIKGRSDLIIDPSAISQLNPEAGFHMQEGMESFVIPQLPKLSAHSGGIMSNIINVVGLSTIFLSILPVALTDFILFFLRQTGQDTIRYIVAWLTGLYRRRRSMNYIKPNTFKFKMDVLNEHALEIAEFVLDSIRQFQENLH
ncbi:uncharacterized protein LOC136042121 [Artemia franciscana]|nr:hypothetical protein QYM36_018362 [Artemia franciscana]